MEILFYIVPILIGITFVLMIALMISPKLRGKLMSSQIKAAKHMMDYSKEDLKDIIEKYDLEIQAIGYDPHNADGFLSDLEEFGVPLLEIKQSARFLHDGTEDMQLNIESRKIKYNKKEELLGYSVSNAKIVKNSFGEKKIDKEKKEIHKRIDPVDAMIDAHITQMKFKEEEAIDYNKEMEDYLNSMGWN